MKKNLNSNRGFLFCLLFLLFFSLGMTSTPKPVTSWWLSLDLGKDCSLNEISIFWNSTYGSTNYSIQGSTDNKTWANLQANQTSAGGKANPTQKDHAISGTYRYVRIYISKAQKIYPIIYEVKVYGSVPAPDTQGPTLEITSPKEGEVIK